MDDHKARLFMLSSGRCTALTGAGGRAGTRPAQALPSSPAWPAYEYSYPDPNCNTRDKIRKAIYSIGKNVRKHYYEQGVVTTDCVPIPGQSSIVKASSVGTFDWSPAPLSASTPMPRSGLIHLETLFAKLSTVTSEGARISLSEFNISLSITGGALPPPKTQDMYISVVHDNKFYPEMTHGQTLLSPVIISGLMQATKKLRKPLIVSLPRCAARRQGNCHPRPGEHQQPSVRPAKPQHGPPGHADPHHTWPGVNLQGIFKIIQTEIIFYILAIGVLNYQLECV